MMASDWLSPARHKYTHTRVQTHRHTCEISVILMLFAPQIKEYEKLDSEEERQTRSRQIYDGYIMKELLSCSHVRHTHTLTHSGQILLTHTHTH